MAHNVVKLDVRDVCADVVDAEITENRKEESSDLSDCVELCWKVDLSPLYCIDMTGNLTCTCSKDNCNLF